MQRNSRWRSIASGVFSIGASTASPTRRSMLLSSAGLRAAAARIAHGRKAVVVLPARSGDADDVELTRRVSEKLDRRARHRGANGGDDELRHVRVDAALDGEGDGAAVDRLGCELVPVDTCAGNAEEQLSRPNVSRVVGQLLDLEGGAPNDLGRAERGDEPLQLHVAR
jgi:hypothetical protein